MHLGLCITYFNACVRLSHSLSIQDKIPHLIQKPGLHNFLTRLIELILRVYLDRVSTSHTGCPRRPINPIIWLVVLYFGEEGICPILFLKMSYKSYKLGLLSYNYFQIHIQPACQQV